MNIPLSNLPDKITLQNRLQEIDAFVKRAEDGDENTMSCAGMNFPKALSPLYRGRLANLLRPWYVWALDQYSSQSLSLLPRTLPMQIVVVRFGDVGFVGFPFEAFVKTGLKIKQEANLPCVLPCGYTDGRFGYIPDASAVDDREYMAGFFRHLGSSGSLKRNESERSFLPRRSYSADQFIPPYGGLAGDEAAVVAVNALNTFAR